MWNEVTILENVGNSRHGRKQNTIARWSQVKQGENQDGEQGADIEVDVPACWVVVCSRLQLGHPCVQVVQSYVTQETEPVDQERCNKVDPGPSPVHRQTLACSNNLFDMIKQYNQSDKNLIIQHNQSDKGGLQKNKRPFFIVFYY